MSGDAQARPGSRRDRMIHWPMNQMPQSTDGKALLTLDYPDAEVVFGIVCAVGTEYRPVVEYLANLLRRARYKTLELHISSFFPEIADKLGFKVDLPEDEYRRID